MSKRQYNSKIDFDKRTGEICSFIVIGPVQLVINVIEVLTHLLPGKPVYVESFFQLRVY